MCSSVDWTVLEKTLESTPQVLAAWVFGSAQDGDVCPGSDLDIGVLFDRPPVLDTLAMLRADLEETLHIPDIDLLVLNGASPITRFEALRGRAVFCRDKGRRAVFASLSARQYEYAMAFLSWGLAGWKAKDQEEFESLARRDQGRILYERGKTRQDLEMVDQASA